MCCCNFFFFFCVFFLLHHVYFIYLSFVWSMCVCVCVRRSSFLCLRFASPNNNVPAEWMYLEVKSFYTNRKFILYIFSRQVFIYSIWRYNDQTFRAHHHLRQKHYCTNDLPETVQCLTHNHTGNPEKEILIWQNGKGICRLVVMTTASGSNNVYNGEMKTVDSAKWKQFQKGRQKNPAILHAFALHQLNLNSTTKWKSGKEIPCKWEKRKKAPAHKDEEDAENRWSCRRKSIDK